MKTRFRAPYSQMAIAYQILVFLQFVERLHINFEDFLQRNVHFRDINSFLNEISRILLDFIGFLWVFS